ncbi:MAG: hypothetical protein ACI837_001157 [Crocinitomicaceae bacterium]|jgi:hypothetical protein
MNRLLVIMLLVCGCSNPSGEAPEKEIKLPPPKLISKETISSGTLIDEADTTKISSKKQSLSKENYPVHIFSLIDARDSTKVGRYKLKESCITFFVKNREQETIKLFRAAGFPMEWWASYECSYYPLDMDSVSYFVQKASDMGHSIYGFECEPLNEDAKSGAFSNSLVVMFYGVNPKTKGLVSHQEMETMLRKYGIFETIQSTRRRYYYTHFEGLGAKEIIKRLNALNDEIIVEYATPLFNRCDGEPHIN